MADTIAQVGRPVELTVSGATPGLLGQLTVEAYDPTDGAPVIAPSPLGITEPRSGTYRAELTFPAAGDFIVRWTEPAEEPEDPEAEAPEARFAEDRVRVLAAVPTPVETWRPTVDEVAAVTPAYTRGGYDDDEDAIPAGAEHATYDDTTSPTAAHVEGLIDAATLEVAGRVGVPIPAGAAGLARVTTVWHVAAAISGPKIAADTEDARGEYRSHITNYRACLDELVRRCRVMGTRLK